METKPRGLCLLGKYYANEPHLEALDIEILEHSFEIPRYGVQRKILRLFIVS